MVRSRDLKEGNIIELKAGNRIPADCVLIWTSEASHSVFIKTDQLDGETDWKLRNPAITTQRMIDKGGAKAIGRSSGYLKSEGPSEHMYDYKASWTDEAGGGVQPLGLEHTLWSSTVLCSAHAYGMVVFIGSETRIRMNIKESPPKSGRLDEELDRMTMWLFGIMFLISIALYFLAGGHGNIFVAVLKYTLLISSIIPISLRVNLDFSKLVLAAKINRDTEINAVTRNSQIPEELGRVGYIFSDKTGTLTQNVMQFRRLSSEYMKIIDKDEAYVRSQIKNLLSGYLKDLPNIGKAVAQSGAAMADSRMASRSPLPNGDSSVENPLKSKRKLIIPKNYNSMASALQPKFQFVVRRTLFDRKSIKPIAVIREILIALNVCHNVTPVMEDGARNLQASSPDEIALVNAAENFGLFLKARTDKRIDLLWTDIHLEQSFTILNNFPFTSKRKRMGIVVHDEISDKIIFYMKGADDIMQSRVQQSQRGFLKDNTDDLARDGLRTLVYAYRIMSREEYDGWLTEYTKAQHEISKRDEMTEKAVDILEANMEILMITGVEDKLQEECDVTIKALKLAGIKFWMLTGDKIETVSCVAISAGLKGPKQEFFVFRDIAKPDELDERLKQFHLTNDGRILVIDSVSLDTAIHYNEEFFFKEAGRAEAVICCRLSPKQKAKVVKLTKKYSNEITLSIGDGGNDVSMIKKAHIGVGIVGKEGKQAALAADFSIDRFKDLKHLVLWHGRNAYKRGALMAQFVIHRGLIISFMQIYFLIIYGFVQVPIFNGYLMLGYTTVYTMLPIFSLIFDEDIDRKNAFQFANLYKDLRRGNELTVKTMLGWIWRSMFQGYMIVVLNVVLFEEPYLDFVGIAFTSLIFVQLFNIITEVHHWNRILVITTLLSAVVYVVTIYFWAGLFGVVNPDTLFYVKSFIIAVMCTLPITLAKRLWRWIDPTDESKLSRRIYLQTQSKIVAGFKWVFRSCWREDVRSAEFV
jgi:phospholipid-translocating ATPase